MAANPHPSSASATTAGASRCGTNSGSGSSWASNGQGQYANAKRASARSHASPVAARPALPVTRSPPDGRAPCDTRPVHRGRAPPRQTRCGPARPSPRPCPVRWRAWHSLMLGVGSRGATGAAAARSSPPREAACRDGVECPGLELDRRHHCLPLCSTEASHVPRCTARPGQRLCRAGEGAAVDRHLDGARRRPHGPALRDARPKPSPAG